MTAAMTAALALALAMAALHALEHRGAARHGCGRGHHARWRSRPRAARVSLMFTFWSYCLVILALWFLVPPAALAAVALADLAGAAHLFNSWRKPV